MHSLYVLRDAESRSISAENPDGSRGAGGMATAETTLHAPSAHHARELGRGWKLSPCRSIGAGETVTIMDQEGPGILRHIWFTLDPAFYRDLVLRIYWDDQERPSVECPVGDFFCSAWNVSHPVTGIPVNVNPRGGLNSFFQMPFRNRAVVAITNDAEIDLPHFFYTINYSLEPVPDRALYFHAQFRRIRRLQKGAVYTLLDGVKGAGHYVGTFMAWEQRSEGWWGEGEVKLFLDGDDRYPTICGTGTEDYFGGAWCFGDNFSAPYMGYRLVDGTEGKPGARMSMYRFHVVDAISFREEFRATVQALGWKSEARYAQLEDDISSVAYWYQTLPHASFPAFPGVGVRRVDHSGHQQGGA